MSGIDGRLKPAIAHGMRLQWEEAQAAHVLLYPEGMVKLNGTAGAILSRCDGVRCLDEIVAELEHRQTQHADYSGFWFMLVLKLPVGT